MTAAAPLLSILIVSYNTRDLLRECLVSVVAATHALPSEIIVVDNASSDGSVAMVSKSFPQVQVIANSENRGFAAANNQAYAISSGPYVLMLNPDTLVRGDAMDSVMRALEELT